MNIDLSDKVAVVTGAAGGIGLAIAKSLAGSGATICLVDIRQDAAESAAADIISKGGKAFAFQADLASEDDIKNIASDILSQFPKADILVNNAGLQFVEPVESFPTEQWDKLLNVMLRGSFLFIREFLPPMSAAGWGRIINIASIHSVVASQYKSAYISAKHGLIGLTKTAALENAEKGITVNAISPAYVKTQLVLDQVKKQAETHNLSEDDVIKKIMLAPMPQKELIEPDEVGQTALFLCSEAARHINGHNLVIDGGWTVT